MESSGGTGTGLNRPDSVDLMVLISQTLLVDSRITGNAADAPYLSAGVLDTSKRQKVVGRGGQYLVEQGDLVSTSHTDEMRGIQTARRRLIAVKKSVPIFGDAEDAKGLRSFMLEMQILSHESLRKHPNIVCYN
jgi:hypothetical protein